MFRNIQLTVLRGFMRLGALINLLSTVVYAMVLRRVTEQRIDLKFLYKLGNSAGENHAMLKQVSGDHTMTLKIAHAWFKKFNAGLKAPKTSNHGR
ncbi:hypothetical protein AVEN_19204-1 [Araneus ventricosus]|uniref:Mos1 transposase HTH domain-containing protein n=1 Tax=Araneus ventricosus TaxID=182803 RepID=A0A4Y2TBF1_ARAVE|nr:hypothetical protein AVEN_19204-1 [Araneus ventricosus]